VIDFTIPAEPQELRGRVKAYISDDASRLMVLHAAYKLEHGLPPARKS
jgi:hypothetical protein